MHDFYKNFVQIIVINWNKVKDIDFQKKKQ